MGLTPEQRAEFLSLVPALGDDADPRHVREFARVHQADLLEELSATPGFEQVRAAALRLLPDLDLDDAAREAALSAAGAALMTETNDHPSERLARHPAWLGLAVLELADLREGWGADAVERAVQLAGRAFVAQGAHAEGAVGAGEVAWAMAEQADEHGWASRAEHLLEWALSRPFARPNHRAQVRLLAAIRRDQRRADARDLLSQVVDDEVADDDTRAHAAWILAHIHLRNSDIDAARAALHRAASLVDVDEEPAIAARIHQALADIS